MVKVVLNGQTYNVDPNSDASLMDQLKEQGAEIVAACNGAGICPNLCGKSSQRSID